MAEHADASGTKHRLADSLFHLRRVIQITRISLESWSRKTYSAEEPSVPQNTLAMNLHNFLANNHPPTILPFLLSSLMDPKNIPISTDPSIIQTPSCHGRSQLLNQGPGLGDRHWWLVPKVTPPVGCSQAADRTASSVVKLPWASCGWNINLCHGFLHGSFTKKKRKNSKENRCRWGQNFTSHWRAASLLVSGTNLFCRTSTVSSLSPESLQHGQKRITVMHEPRQCWTVETPPFSKTLKTSRTKLQRVWPNHNVSPNLGFIWKEGIPFPLLFPTI